MNWSNILKNRGLIFSLVTLSCSAMEQVEPINVHASANTQDTSVANSCVNSINNCAICCEKVESFDPHGRAHAGDNTNNHAFIEQPGYAPKEVAQVMCPLCRTVDFKTPAAFLKKVIATAPKAITVIDSNNERKLFSLQDSAILLKCETIKELFSECNGEIDFTKTFHQIPIPNALLSILIKLIENPRLFVGLDEISSQLLEIADYLGAPKDILFAFSNAAWPSIQPALNDSEQQASHKSRLRTIARPHLNSPAQLLNLFKKRHMSDLKSRFHLHAYINNHFLKGATIDLRSITMMLYHSEFTKEMSHPDGLLYNHNYPFGSLDGLAQLVSFLRSCAYDSAAQFDAIDLSGNALDAFSLQEINKSYLPEWRQSHTKSSYTHINLANNLISVLWREQLENCGNTWNFSLDLRNNPITRIENTVFDEIKKWRIKSKEITLDLQENSLTPEQKAEYRKKIYKATHTIPDRYKSLRVHDMVLYKASLVTGLLAGTMASCYLGNRSLSSHSSWAKPAFVAATSASTAAIGLCMAGMSNINTLGVFAAGAIASAVGSYASNASSNSSWLLKASLCAPLAVTGSVAGVFAGMLTYEGIDRSIQALEKGLARITHPETEWARGRKPDIKL